MSQSQQQLYINGASAQNMIKSDDNIRGQSKQLLSNEKREMLLHYFNQRGTAVNTLQQPRRQETAASRSGMGHQVGEVGLVSATRYYHHHHQHCSSTTPHYHTRDTEYSTPAPMR